MLNMCSHFLPQLVGLNKFTAGFKGAFIANMNDELEPYTHIYILMEHDSSMLDIHPDTVDKVSYEDGNLYTMRVNERFSEDLAIFFSGKYSRMSADTKRVMLDNCGLDPAKSLCYHVLYRTKTRRKFLEDLIGEKLPEDAELMSVLNINKEIYG